MINKDAVGARGTPFIVEIERGKIIEFATAVQSAHPEHLLNQPAVVPPTFLTTQLFWEKLVPGANPWALAGMSEERGMHAEQSYRFFGPPPHAGQRLIGSSTITEITDKPNKSGQTLTFVKMVTEFRDTAGRLVAEAVLTGVERNPTVVAP